MLKKILIAALILVTVVVLSLVVFLATFDMNRYRSVVVKELESFVGNRVRVDHMGLRWQDGFALELTGVSVYPDREPTRDPVLELGQVRATLQLRPLLHRSIQIGSMVVDRPRIHVIRMPQGTIKVLGLSLQSRAVTRSSPFALLIRDVRVEDGIFRFTDNQTQLPFNLIATDMDFQLKDVSWTGNEVRGEIKLTDGKISLDGIGAIERIRLDAVGARNRIELKQLSGNFANGTFKGSGLIDELSRIPQLHLRFTAERLHLDALLPSGETRRAQLVGLLGISLEGDADLPALAGTMTGDGRVSVSGVALLHVNLLREVFNRLSLIPGLVSRLENRLPEAYRARLETRDTAFRPIDAFFQLRDRRIYFDQLDVATDDFKLAVTGSIGFNRTIEARGMLRIHPYLAEAFVRSVTELDALRDPEGYLLIPVLITGSLGELRFFPDVKGVAARLAVAKTSELLSDLLD